MFFCLPSEVTTIAAWRIEKAVTEALVAAGHPVGSRTVSAIAMVNDYMGYLTTPEEYALQNFEGAMTWYGRRSHEVLRDRLRELVSDKRELIVRLHERRDLPEVRDLDRVLSELKNAWAVQSRLLRQVLESFFRLGGER